ncbi:D-alanyl-D-alanine carboxypeptidase [Bacillus thermophilus]|uniref:D-alanyl-D-alanine carboxypeptidase n=1 Tax=Siminovitchia thermophila TaxID=1245522 RepID=A0ABS2R8B0_9BACI|nr:serine hydrolase [Siminovitchia thermophila]MBM7715414.1 D-alanyl-D-alanine carboxypeptidase [Siminovitchia thermophila]
MNIYAWIGLMGILLLSSVPLFKKSQRSKGNILRFAVTTVIVLGVIFFVEVMGVSFILAIIAGCILLILLDKKTYTKKRMMIYASLTLIIITVLYFLLKHNPEYTLNHLMKHPESSSLFVAMNDEEMITYQSDIPRPLASVVKIIVAIEYAYQIENGDLHKDATVPLETVNRYYIENTDGGGHQKWLEQMEEAGQIENDKVKLRDIAKGMIAFSSNANTDYLIDVLGVESINNRIDQLALKDHDDVYPLVGALLALNEYKKEKKDTDWQKELREMSDENYKKEALIQSEKMKHKKITVAGVDLSVKEQRVWSDRMPKASPATYGRLLHMISREGFPSEISHTLRDLMEWPMEMIPENKEHYRYIGAKGGSTAFIYNQAMYFEDLSGNQMEFVLFMDDLSLWESMMLQFHSNSFIVEMVNNKQFRKKVQSTLQAYAK